MFGRRSSAPDPPGSRQITTVDGRVRLSGSLGLDDANRIYHGLRACRPDDKRLVVDLSETTRVDTIARAAVIAGCRPHASRGVTIEITGPLDAASEIERALAAEAPGAEPPPPFLETVGRSTLQRVENAGVLFSMAGAAASGIAKIAGGRTHLPRLALGDKVASMGADAVGIVALLSTLLGMILAFEATEQLGELGAKPLIPDVVGLSLIREFAPLLCAVVVIARNGAAIASELASMSTGQEVDALRTMGIDPVQYLVVPRTLALLITTPVLTLLGMFVGLLGATGISIWVADLDLALFYRRLTDAVGLNDLAFGLGKSVVFAATTGLASAAVGLSTRGSAADVGRATTRAVVLGIFLLVVVDAMFSFLSGLSDV